MASPFIQNLRRGYCIIPLTLFLLTLLSAISFRETRIASGRKTDTHKHLFFSFYIVSNMEKLQTPTGDLPLPSRALVIVVPFILNVGLIYLEGRAIVFVDLSLARTAPYSLGLVGLAKRERFMGGQSSPKQYSAIVCYELLRSSRALCNRRDVNDSCRQ